MDGIASAEAFGTPASSLGPVPDSAKVVRLTVMDMLGRDLGEYLEIPYSMIMKAMIAAKLPGLDTRKVPEKHNHPVPGQASYYYHAPYLSSSDQVTDAERAAWIAGCPKCQLGDPIQ